MLTFWEINDFYHLFPLQNWVYDLQKYAGEMKLDSICKNKFLWNTNIHNIHETKLMQNQKFVACNSSNWSHMTHCISKSTLKSVIERRLEMFEMIIYILHFTLSRSNRNLQEFQSTCRQRITRTVASTDAAINNMHFLFFTTFIGDSVG